MARIADIVSNLRQERSRTAEELERLDQAITALSNLDRGAARTGATRRPRTLSAAARRRISAAQRARWANAKSEKAQPSSSAPRRRVMSAASRKKIAAAKRAWWAKQKKAA